MTDYEAYDKIFSKYPDVVSIKDVSKMLGLGIRNGYASWLYCSTYLYYSPHRSYQQKRV